jgi:hypothetical protein
MKRKHLTETPVCPWERLVIINYTTGLSFALERIGPLTAIIIIVFYLFALYLLALPNTPENPFTSIYSESLIKTTHHHLLLLVGFDTLIYRKYYDTPPILVGHQDYFLAPFPGSEALLKSGIGKGNRHYEYCFYLCLYFYFILLWRVLHLVSYLGTLLPLLRLWMNHHLCRCSGYRGIPVHLLLGPIIGPSSAQGRTNDPSYEEDPHEENDGQNC